MIVADLMRAKPVTVRPETSLAVAAVLMLTRGLSGVMVVDEAGRLAGVLTLEDLLRRTAPGAEGSAANWLEAFLISAPLAEDEARTLQRHVSEVMTPDPVCIAPGDTVAVAAVLMRERRVTRLPVVADGLLVGVISRFDLLAALVARLARDEAAMPSDTDIQDDIEMALNRETWVPKSGIRVTVQGGHVVLAGVIMSDYERRAVRLIAENVFGVVSVTDNMVFAGPAGDGSIHVA